MKKATPTIRTWLAAVVSGLCLAATANAAVVYHNGINDQVHRFDIGTTEIGDEIILNLSGGEKYITSFSFEYWGLSSTPGLFAGDVEIKAKLYANDGPLWNGEHAAPGTVLYESIWFGIAPTARSTMNYLVVQDFPGPGIFVPSPNITLAVQFQGLGLGDSVGIDVYDPPIIGSGYNDYWENDGGVWKLKEQAGQDISMGAVVVAVVPEPSSMALAALGLIGFFASRRRN